MHLKVEAPAPATVVPSSSRETGSATEKISNYFIFLLYTGLLRFRGEARLSRTAFRVFP